MNIVDTTTTLSTTKKARPLVRVPPFVSSTKAGRRYERSAHVQAEICKILSLPPSRWIGEAENWIATALKQMRAALGIEK